MIGIGILIGGKSSRMGRAKSQLDFFGLSLLERKLEMWKDFPVLLSVGKRENLPDLQTKDIQILEDTYPNSGPVGGIYEILKSSYHTWNFICAVDLPFLTKEIPEFLELFAGDRYDCILFTSKNQIHPLCGLYRRELAEVFERALKSDHLKLIQLIHSLRVKYIPLEKTNFPSNLLDNINHPHEYIRSFGNCISICGLKNTGKTTFIKGVVHYLSKKGLNIAVLKHDGMHDFSIDQEGTDTFSYIESGAKKVIIYNASKIARISYEKNIDYREIIKREWNQQDILLIEGLKGEPIPKFEILRKGVSEVPISNPVNRLGIISDLPENSEKGLYFKLGKPEVFAEYLYTLFIDR